MPIAYDLCSELTYPEPEGVTSGILTMPTQIFGIFFTLICREMIEKEGITWMNAFECASLVVGALLHTGIGGDLRRQAVTNSNNALN